MIKDEETTSYDDMKKKQLIFAHEKHDGLIQEVNETDASKADAVFKVYT